jgi:hypothetical protein
MRKLYEVAAGAGSLSQQEWGRIKDISVSEVVRTSIEKRNVPYHQRLTTRKAHHTPLSIEQVRQLKQQPDTAQGRRDAFLLCLILDHHLSGTVLESLPAQALDVQKRTLYLPGGKSILLSDDALEAGRRYIERAAPQNQLIRGSKRGGALQGGMTARGQADRIRFLGQQIGIPSLSPQDCQLWDRPVRQSPKEVTSDGNRPLLVPESIVPRGEDTRPRYDKRRLVLEVIQQKNGEETVHYLGYDLCLAHHLLASLGDVHGDSITVLNFYQRGQLGLTFPFACLDRAGKNEPGFEPKNRRKE